MQFTIISIGKAAMAILYFKIFLLLHFFLCPFLWLHKERNPCLRAVAIGFGRRRPVGKKESAANSLPSRQAGNGTDF
jgi:hypothetical protein